MRTSHYKKLRQSKAVDFCVGPLAGLLRMTLCNDGKKPCGAAVGYMNFIKKIKSFPREKVLFLGVGNAALGDDGAGPYFISLLEKSSGRYGYKFFDCGLMPENFFSKISALKPCLIVFVDAADFGGVPGEIRELNAAEIDGLVSTHAMPLSVLAEFLRKEISPAPEFIFIGAQSASLKFGAPLGKPVSDSINNLISELL